jgi:hypothetical protein
MTLDEFKRTLTGVKPPAGVAPALAALWWARKADWRRAHEIVMEAGGADAAWVHAYLHRAEGDLPNARDWYRRAGRDAVTGSLDDEWAAIAAALLTEPSDPALPAAGGS